ncbi:DNA translocase FtsK [Bacillus sp. FJAT-45350]|uniref:DNA translocase FtsK n=1 Tax=Bacillus sp. FJAT-45350 TaxID=2011014 RepID=UPI000BB7D203|nr:DNA translocase FtsK [Bacillus sp. FJAT-45350]
MGQTFQQLIKKMQNLFLGTEDESVFEVKEKPVAKKQVGRFQSDYRNSDPKMIHKYPEGNFRFPLVDDSIERKAKVEERKTKRYEKSSGENYEQSPSRSRMTKEEPPRNPKHVSGEREKFSNSNFRPSSIPSPVYGFSKKQEKEKENIVPILSINNSKPTASVQEEVAATLEKVPSQTSDNIAEEKANTVSYFPSEKEEDFVVEKPEDTAAVEIEEAPIEQAVVQEKVVEEYEENVELIEEERLDENVEKYKESLEEEIFEEPAVDNEEAIVAETNVDSTELGFDFDTETLSEPSEEKVEPVVKHVVDEPILEESVQELGTSKKEVTSNEAVESNPTTNSSGAASNENEKIKKVEVPFNVMMFQRDKVKQRKLEKQTVGGGYQFPGLHMLNVPPKREDDDHEWLEEKSKLLETTLENFNVNAKVVHVTKGPSVTRFEIQPAPGVKVSKITGLTDDIKLCLAAKDIRMEAPIPGKNAIGIEIPNLQSSAVGLREILRQEVFQKNESPLTVALGLDISGNPIVTDLKKMPHGLVAGATGSGKSVCINSILVSLMYKATPDEVKLMLIDPKMVELAPYNELPHLVTPVITDAKQATIALKWVVEEMERRYELFSQRGVRDLGRYNDLYSEEEGKPALPYIVVVIDELADLMMVSPQDVEEAICRIAQKARACGIHLLLATQRPSVDVITGLIKANIPTRIAFSVSSQTDSRTIIDMNGAERLLGKGDMLFHENGSPKPIRVQGTFVSDDEIETVIQFVKKQKAPNYLIDNEQLVKVQEHIEQDDDLFEEACYYVIEQDGASSSSLQRRFRVGFNRAARLIDMMEAKGLISEAMGSKPRNVLMTVSEFEETILNNE